MTDELAALLKLRDFYSTKWGFPYSRIQVSANKWHERAWVAGGAYEEAVEGIKICCDLMYYMGLEFPFVSSVEMFAYDLLQKHHTEMYAMKGEAGYCSFFYFPSDYLSPHAYPMGRTGGICLGEIVRHEDYFRNLHLDILQQDSMASKWPYSLSREWIITATQMYASEKEPLPVFTFDASDEETMRAASRLAGSFFVTKQTLLANPAFRSWSDKLPSGVSIDWWRFKSRQRWDEQERRWRGYVPLSEKHWWNEKQFDLFVE